MLSALSGVDWIVEELLALIKACKSNRIRFLIALQGPLVISSRPNSAITEHMNDPTTHKNRFELHQQRGKLMILLLARNMHNAQLHSDSLNFSMLLSSLSSCKLNLSAK
jgi:hypothetical protein